MMEAVTLCKVGFSYGGPAVMAAAAMALLASAAAAAAAAAEGAEGSGCSECLHAVALGRMAGVVTLGCGMRVRPQGDLVEVGRAIVSMAIVSTAIVSIAGRPSRGVSASSRGACNPRRRGLQP